ncbi:MAG: hypothetical protein HGA61_00925 [Candidatus Moranbacteria bacterium]|nr:hypothetical protein [Candidatus Moranbacteria bacterium]
MGFEKIKSDKNEIENLNSSLVRESLESVEPVLNPNDFAEKIELKMKNISKKLEINESEILNFNKIEINVDSYKKLLSKFDLIGKLKRIDEKIDELIFQAYEKIKAILSQEGKRELTRERIDNERNYLQRNLKEDEYGEKIYVCDKCGYEQAFRFSLCLNCGNEMNFDPEAELKKIRRGSREERNQNLNVFKEKMIEQKKGIALIQKALFEKIGENPDETSDEYFESIRELVDRFSLSHDQQLAIKKGLQSYSYSHRAIKENIEDCKVSETGKIDGPKLYEKLFNRKPIGRIEVIVRPAMIYIRVENLDDYVVSYNYGAIDNVTDDLKQVANKSCGCKLVNFKIKGLENAIALENATDGEFDTMSMLAWETLKHEEQHVFNETINQSFNPEQQKINKKMEWYTRNFGEDKHAYEKDVLEKYLEDKYDRNIGIENLIKDEISAYFIEGKSTGEILNILLKPTTIYRYGFDYKGGDKEKSKFSQKYIELVKNGISAYNQLLKQGYSREDAQGLLYVEPLSKWIKVVERLGKKNKHKK